VLIESIVALALTLPDDPTLKCPRTHTLPGYSEDDVTMVLDGDIHRVPRGENVMDSIEPSEVEVIEVACWDPDADEIPARRGIPLVVVATKSSRSDAESAMRRAVRATRSYLASHAELPSSIEALDPTLLGYSIEIRDGAWTLTSAAHRGHMCTATEVDIAQGTMRCDDVLRPAAKAVREAWEAGQQAR